MRICNLPSTSLPSSLISFSLLNLFIARLRLLSIAFRWITNGVWADYFMTVVRTGPAGPNGISILLIPRQDAIKVRPLETSGGVLSGTSYVSFENALCPVDNVLGELNQGFKALLTNFNYERWTICITSLRSARVCFADALAYATKRKTFGKKLIEHAILKDKFARE